MAKLTEKMIKSIMPYAPSAKIRALLPIMTAVAIHYRITTARRLRFWLATLAIESGELKYTSELGVHPEYEGRRDLGNTQKGDGVKFEGHGNIQLTGRDVHTQYTKYLKASGHLPFVDFVKFPEKLAEQPYAMDSAGWFVNGYKDLNPLADANNFLMYQVRVNGRNRRTGKPNHWKERQEYLRRASTVIADNFVLTSDGETLQIEKIEKARVEDVKNYPDFEIPSTPVNPNIENPNGEDDVADLDTATTEQEPSGASDTSGDGAKASVKIDGDKIDITGQTSGGAADKVAVVKPPSFFGYIKTEITAFFGGNLSIDAAAEKAGQVQALGLPYSFWSKVIYLAILATVIYFVVKIVRHVQANRKTEFLVKANTTDANTVILVDEKDVESRKAEGYKIITR